MVIGAGVVGLACAVTLAREGCEVLVLDRASTIGSETSSRNSEVVHAGMYYPTGSLKHRLCTSGRRMLYDYMTARGVAHRRCGKLIVATSSEEVAQIEALHARGLANGVEGLELITGSAAELMEPALSCQAAMWSPETGILDSHALMTTLVAELESLGGAVALNTMVASIDIVGDDEFAIRIGGSEPFVFRARRCVNAAGLHAQEMASRIQGLSLAFVPELTLAKGSYFSAAMRPAFSRLIYPAPVEGGLGVHLTLDLGGRMRFGPDVEWLDHANPNTVDYAVDPARAAGFYAAIRRYWPGLPDDVLVPDYAGCRAKVKGGDFIIDGSDRHGVPGLVNLFGIESPGLTSSLAVAKEVAALLV